MHRHPIAIALLFLIPLSHAFAADEPFVLENEHLRVEFARRDGTITRIRNKDADLEMISAKQPVPRPWVLLLGPARFVSEISRFHASETRDDTSHAIHFEWETQQDIMIAVDAELKRGSDSLTLRPFIKNAGNETIIAFRYPDLQGIGPLEGDGKQDQFLHSTMMGAVFDGPFHLFSHQGPIPQQHGMVVSRYPNGFHGSALQLMAYYVKGRGGFYIATEDGRSTDKDFNFFKAASDSLSSEISHFNWNAKPGADLALDYPIVIASMCEGTWYEAAERYRQWAGKQDRCSRGTRRERLAKGDTSKWLTNELGVVGMWWPFRDDIRADIDRTQKLFDAPMLHLELWWQHRQSVDVARRVGNRFGPFFFPNLALKGKPTFESRKGDAIFPPAFSITPDWVAMCCSQPGWREVFAETAEDMVGHEPLRHHQIWMDGNKVGCDADCLYFDIGPCAGIPTHCYASNHDHPPGAGRHITDGHISLLRESQRRASQRKGAYVPIGTECISEPFLGVYDLYYPRNAGLGLDMELLPYIRQLTWLPDGKMEAIPLFTYVYHEHGPVAVQGLYSADPWSIPEAVSYNTWSEARAYLWGGLMTSAPLKAETMVPAERQRFLRSLMAARTKFAADYLAFGRMQRPPAVNCGTTEIDHGLGENGWVRKHRFENKELAAKTVGFETKSRDGEESKAKSEKSEQKQDVDLSVEKWVAEMLAIGATTAKTKSLRVPSVVTSAYTIDNDRLGLLLVNLLDKPQTGLELRVDPSQYGMNKGPYRAIQRTMDSETDLNLDVNNEAIRVELPPREVVLIEIVR